MTGSRRETIARYDPERASKPATAGLNLSAGSLSKPANLAAGPPSAAEPYREVIAAGLAKGLSAQRIWQDLRADYGFAHAYSSVKRFVRRMKLAHPEVVDVMEHPPGEEAQVRLLPGRSYPGPEERQVAKAVDLPDDALLFTARLRGAGVGTGPGDIPAGP